MTKVSNKKAIRHLVFRELKCNRKMNIVVMISIVLTCILFTSLTSIGGSLINGMQQETMRQVGGDRMAGLKYVLPEDYDNVKEDSETRDVVYRIIVGSAVNADLKNTYAEFNCAGDKNAAKAVFSLPTEGRLPESYDEIALSTIVLDELRLPYELGTSVPITLDVDGDISEHTFRLCGYWQGDQVASAQECWVSRAFADKYAPTPAESFYMQEYPKYAGYWQVDFNYANSWDIEGKTEELLERLYGSSATVPDMGINWAYTTSSVDGGMIAGGIMMILLIFAAGYLIIYNIFHINISANIRSYGLLKTIGTTSKQIKQMVRLRAAIYSAFGIPAGLILGILLSKLMMKSIMSMLSIRSANSYSMNAKLLLLICLISAVFSFVTVMISCLKPCRIAGSVSPIEALRYNDTVLDTKKKDKKTGNITPYFVARNNMSRNRKKTVIVVFSLSLSMILVNTLFTVLKGVDEDKFISNSIVGDIIIRHTENTDLLYERAKGVSLDMITELEHIDGAEICPVYFEYGNIRPDNEPLERLKKLYEKYRNNEHQEQLLSSAIADRYSADIYGIDEKAAVYLEPSEGVIDIDKLSTGSFAIIHTYLWNADYDSDVEIYHPGDMITVECGEGNIHEYEVMAVCEMPYPLSTKIFHGFGTQVIISTEEYLSMTDKPGAACVMIDTDDESGLVNEKCRAYCNSDGSPLVYFDKQTYLDQFNDFIKMIKLVSGTLSGILALIGILNFVNAVVTGILSRKRELAMMSAVGMTGRQQQKMLLWEGIYYTALTTVCSLIFSVLLSRIAVQSIAGELFFFSYHFTLLPILMCVPILLLLSALIPFAAYMMICRESIVDRLRVE